jgi:hypothetical protein
VKLLVITEMPRKTELGDRQPSNLSSSSEKENGKRKWKMISTHQARRVGAYVGAYEPT